MPVNIVYENTDYQLDKQDLVRKIVHQIVIQENKKLGEITFFFVDNNRILEINSQFLNHNYYTDIITFSNNFLSKVGGDIYISVDTVLDNAKFHSNNNFQQELFRNVIHGVLHLLGYDDRTMEQKAVMRKREDYYLELLRKI